MTDPADEQSARRLHSGISVDLGFWLRVRAALLPPAERIAPLLTDGDLADIADAACQGFVDHSRADGFKEQFSRMYARLVMLELGGPVTDPATEPSDETGYPALQGLEAIARKRAAAATEVDALVATIDELFNLVAGETLHTDNEPCGLCDSLSAAEVALSDLAARAREAQYFRSRLVDFSAVAQQDFARAEAAEADRDRLARRVAELEAALRWYAERRNYVLPGGEPSCQQHGSDTCAVFHRDAYDDEGPGARARSALAGDGGGA